MSEDPVTSTGGTDGAALPGQDDRPGSIVQVGAGAGGDATQPSLLVGLVLGVLISAALWWAYFGYIRAHAERPPAIRPTAPAS